MSNIKAQMSRRRQSGYGASATNQCQNLNAKCQIIFDI